MKSNLPTDFVKLPKTYALAVLSTAAILLFLPAGSRAHVSDPTLERGFSADQVYQFNDLDSVNLFNGNLGLDVPIGPVYRVGGNLSYQLRLVYNSQIWDFEYDFACTINSAPITISGDVWSSLYLLEQVLYQGPPDGSQECYTIAVPNRKSNAGTGWSLGFGQLYPPRDTRNGLHGPLAVNDMPTWLYVSPDGAEHSFHPSLHGEAATAGGDVLYSRDGSFLRLRVGTETPGAARRVEVEMPDGIVHTFEEHVHLEDQAPGPETHWRLVEMRDPFDNFVTITYVGDSDLEWRIEDSASASRQHTVKLAERTFPGDPAFADVPRLERTVEYVELAGPGGTTSRYDFEYSLPRTLLRGCPSTWDGEGSQPGGKFTDIYQLVGLKQPDGTQFRFDYAPNGEGDLAYCSNYAGRLRAMTLPTGGGVAYEYGPFVAARERCDDPNRQLRDGFAPQFVMVTQGAGVVSRREVTDSADLADPTQGAETRYVRYFGGDWDFRFPSSPSQCDLPKTGVTALFEPAVGARRRVTLNYFSIYQGGAEWDDATGAADPGFAELGWDRTDYGLPFTRESSAFGPWLPDVANDPADPERRISRDVYDCPAGDVDPQDPTNPDVSPFAAFTVESCDLERRVFVKYEKDPAETGTHCGPGTSLGPCTALDRRVAESVTYFLDDPACTVAGIENQSCYSESRSEDYDGLGHYRRQISASGFGPTRTEWTEFNPASLFDVADPTTFVPPSTASPWILGTFASRQVTESGPHAGSAFENLDFDPDTGFLREHRRHRGTYQGSTLATITTEYLPDGDGNVEWETYSGGDDGNLVGAPDYVLHHDYQNGVLRRTEYRDPAAQSRVVLRTVDRDIDAATGLVLTSRDSAGVATGFSYDEMWRLDAVTPADPRDAETTYEYVPADPQGPARVRVRTLRQDGASGGMAGAYCPPYDTVPFDALTQEEYQYDGLGRRTRSRTWMPDGKIAEIATVYTTQGLVARETTPYDACGGYSASRPAATTTYDVFGRPDALTSPDGSFLKNTYQGARREVRTLHGVGSDAGETARTELTYDHLGRLIRLSEPSGGGGAETAWWYAYDEGGRIVRVSIGGQIGSRISFDYDPTGFLLSETHPELAGVTIFHEGYDAVGNARGVRYGLGSRFDLDLVHDAAARLVRVDHRQSSLPLVESFYGRHGRTDAGKLVASKRHNFLDLRGTGGDETSRDDVVVSRTNSYAGPSGRLSSQRIATGGRGGPPRAAFTSHYTYDPLGDVASIDYPDCTGTWCFATDETGQRLRDESVSPLRAASFTHEAGRLSRVEALDATTAPGSRFLAGLAYHLDGLVSSIARGNGATDTIAADPAALGRPSAMAASGTGGSLWSSGGYTYDGAGNVRTIGTDTFQYDRVHRLTSASLAFDGETYSRSYTYDAFGNLLTRDGSPLYADSSTNRIDVWAYDVAGNVTAPGDGYTYEWDPLGAMTRASKASGSPDRMHLYDAAGERLAVLFRSGGATTRELWSLRGPGNRVLRDVEYMPGADGTGAWQWQKDYVHRGGGLLASFSPGAERHYHLDHLGTPRALSDAAGQLVSRRHKYLPFGEEIDPPADIGSERLRFTGHERDDLGPVAQLSDLDYMHARFYRPSAGRFLSVDPVLGRPEAPQSWNRYSYVSNRPLFAVDPTGERGQEATGTYAELASCTYPGKDCGDTVDGFFRVQSYSPGLDNGVTATLWGSFEGDYVLVYAGTDEVQDWDDNAGQSIGLETGQYEFARWVAATALKDVRGWTGRTVPNLTFVGHSLGGGLAAASAYQTGLKAVTFNAAGVHPLTAKRMGFSSGWNASAAITNYFVPGEVLTSVQSMRGLPAAIGRQIVLPDPGNVDFITRHSMRTVCAAFGRDC